MRTHQRTLLLVITVLTIIAFAFLYTSADFSAPGAGTVARVAGRDLTQSDFQREARKYQLALALGLVDYVTALGATGGDEGVVDFVVNKIVLENEAAKLGIRPSDAEVAKAIAALPVFQTGGQFDPQRYREMVVSNLTPQGFTELEIQHLVRGSLVLERLKQVLNAAPAVSAAETAFVDRVFQPVSGLAFTFDREAFGAQVKITDEQITAAFQANAAQLVTPEVRTARYVVFPLPEGIEKMDAKAKLDAQQKVADASDAFVTKASEVGFDKAAQEAGLKIETTLPFNQQGQPQVLADLQAQLGSSVKLGGPTTALAPSVFTLTKESPLTGVVQDDNTFLVGVLDQVTPSRPQTLEEAKPRIVAELTRQAAGQAMDAAANTALTRIRQAAQAGQNVAEAAKAANLTVQPFTNVTLADEAAPAEQRRFADTAMPLNPGEVSGLRADPTGGYFLWLEKRGPVDETIAAKARAEITTGILSQRETILWMEWLRRAQENAKVSFPGQERS